MLLLVLLAILAIVAFGVGFTIHWLFVVAIILALLWVISLFMGSLGGRTRSTGGETLNDETEERGRLAAPFV